MDFIYTGIRVKDLDRSIEFYTKTMGMKEVGRGKMKDQSIEYGRLRHRSRF